MIKTTRQLKDKIRTISAGRKDESQLLFRNYIMERFLERVSVSKYNDKFILKGGMLVASLVGLNMRATRDIDTTIQALHLTLDEAQRIIQEIAAIEIDDGVTFRITSAKEIMEEHDYNGVRLNIEATFQNARQAMKFDISTGDVITPCAIAYSYPLMFEDRCISILSYNIETLLAEKIETMLARSTANTRMRDFYDVHIITQRESANINYEHLYQALTQTCKARGTEALLATADSIWEELRKSETMQIEWERYKENSFYVQDVSWDDVIQSVEKTMSRIVESPLTDLLHCYSADQVAYMVVTSEQLEKLRQLLGIPIVARTRLDGDHIVQHLKSDSGIIKNTIDTLATGMKLPL